MLGIFRMLAPPAMPSYFVQDLGAPLASPDIHNASVPHYSHHAHGDRVWMVDLVYLGRVINLSTRQLFLEPRYSRPLWRLIRI